MKSTRVRAHERAERWLCYDASEHTLGRMASQIAMNLMGKDEPTWTPNERTGAHVVVINGSQARLTGKKSDTKTYVHYTRYAGGQKHVALGDVLERRPEDVVTLAVRRMLPKSKLGKAMLSRLKVYPGPDHPHTAQQPVQVQPS
jgi:large subunit ribosomal protein L13